jgi:hypothetical protein
MGFTTAQERQNRQDLVPLAVPQGGVDAMAGRFTASTPIAGVTDNGDSATRAVPAFSMEENPPPGPQRK